MKIRSVLNGGVAEVGDDEAATLIESGMFVAGGDGPVRKPRATRAKKAPAEDTETEV